MIYNEVNSRQEIIGVYHIKEKIISMSIHLKTTPRLYMKFPNYVKCKITIYIKYLPGFVKTKLEHYSNIVLILI